jgi:hypothetical protein
MTSEAIRLATAKGARGAERKEGMEYGPERDAATRFPAGACDMTAALGRSRSLAGIRAGGTALATFPEAHASSGELRKSCDPLRRVR